MKARLIPCFFCLLFASVLLLQPQKLATNEDAVAVRLGWKWGGQAPTSPASPYLQQEVRTKAYEGLELNEVRESAFKVKFVEPQSIRASLEKGKGTKLRASHLEITITDNDGKVYGEGGVILPNSINTNEETIKEAIASLLQIAKGYLLETKDELRSSQAAVEESSPALEMKASLALEKEIEHLKVENVLVRGFQAIILPDEHKAITSKPFWVIEKMARVEPAKKPSGGLNPISYEMPTDKFLGDGNSNFMPNTSYITVDTLLGGYWDGKRHFRWMGIWTDQARIDSLHVGKRPAFEPDIKLKFKTFLVPIGGWAQLWPRHNYLSWWSNFTNAYVDSQSLDFADRAYTIGTTEANAILLGQWYYTLLLVNPWKDSPSGLEYKFQRWDRHRWNCEADAWCVGLFSRGDEIQVLPMRSQAAPTSLGFGH